MKLNLSILGITLLGAIACQQADAVIEKNDEQLPKSAHLKGADVDDILNSLFCSSPQPGQAPLRRLSNNEIKNSITDLFGEDINAELLTANLIQETESLGFRNGASALQVSPVLVQAYLDIGMKLIPMIKDVVTTDCSSKDDKECLTERISIWGRRIYRRPLTTDEIKTWNDFAQEVSDSSFGKDLSLAWVVAGMLQSPHFIHRVEKLAKDSEPVPVTAYEAASRLSFLLWQSSPDDALLDAANSGKLDDRSGILEEATRLLKDPKAYRVYEFYSQWLDLDSLKIIDRDPTLYPDLVSNLPALLRTENQAFVTNLLSSGKGSFQDLMTSEKTFVNAALAEHYGLSSADIGERFEEVDAPGRYGILSQGMLVSHDNPSRSSIVKRGYKIRTSLLCLSVPPPPDDVNFSLDGISPDLSQRERLALHRAEPACSGCHALMDPIGEIFEGFDAVGRKRTKDEYGGEILTNSSVTNTRDINGDYDNPAEFAEKLSQSAEAQECMMTQSFTFFYGREPENADLCSQAQVMKKFIDSDYNLTQLLVALVESDQFLFKPGTEKVTP